MGNHWNPWPLVGRLADGRHQERVSRTVYTSISWRLERIFSTMSTHKDLRFQPGSVIAASLTSPLDALYLAAIFDPVFTASYPSTRLLERISLLTAILRAFSQPQEVPPKGADLIDIPTLVSENPGRFIVVFPECTTTNGRGILRLSQSLLTASTKTKIWPMSLRYTPADITTPVPKEYLSFLWNLLSKPTHSLRVRVAQSVSTLPTLEDEEGSPTFDVVQDDALNGSNGSKSLNGLAITVEEHRFLDKIAETLARLGRNKRLGLGVREKQQFVEVWSRHRRR